MNKDKIDAKYKVRNLAVPLNAYEATLIAELRESGISFGQMNVEIHMFEGVPIRIVVNEKVKSSLLNPIRGLNIKDARVLAKGEDLIQ